MKILIFLFFCGVNTALMAQNHLLLSEITLQPAEAEFIEIFNPTDSAILLDEYYLADNKLYPYVPNGGLPALDAGDFIAKFPEGALLNSNKTAVIAFNGGNFETNFARKADFEMYNMDPGTPDMILVSANSATLANAGEGIALFYWNGSDSTVKDVDLMNAGIPTASSQIVDKSSISGYLPDAHTIPVQGHNGPPGNWLSTKRILLEAQYEIHSGGNGITGDDETSEDISVTWDDVYTSPTPGSTGLPFDGIEFVQEPKNSLTIFPNPFTVKCTMEFVKPSSETSDLIICDILGKIILKKNNIKENKIIIDDNSFAPGIYFYKIANLNTLKRWQGKLIKSE